MKRFSVFLALLALLSGCSTTPPTSVHQPMTARPDYRPVQQAANGSIFQDSSARPLFEDRRARYVGDTLTVTITENNRAASDSSTGVSRTGSISAGVDGLSVYPLDKVSAFKKIADINLGMNSSNDFSGSGNAASNNVFQGTITVTVIEVFPNGNILVSGEKMVSIGGQQEFIRLSGVVNPRDVVSETNSVSSSRIADARIEYKANGVISEAQTMGWLSRFFLSVLPF
ncbi:MAG: flagellar basal body L-ring protein FlgH [Zoogloeaceae bacterium]|jgi:flagellar L-ring protein precursor FlgH|nr:flagellar basal body L-ring protein FlgH [Zoogloeaceae bacterium]